MRDPGHRVTPCRCDCGTERDVLTFLLVSGRSQSCGCLKREQVSTLVKRTRWKDSHGRSGTPLYQLWRRIRRRCYDPKAHNYRYYGGRGITVCDAWRNDAGAFIAWIEANLGPCPPGRSLDRVNNDGNYEPGNLRWATRSQQVRNRRAARLA
jgi:hypothetical protein